MLPLDQLTEAYKELRASGIQNEGMTASVEVQRDTLGVLPFESMKNPGEMVHAVRMRRAGRPDLLLLSDKAYYALAQAGWVDP